VSGWDLKLHLYEVFHTDVKSSSSRVQDGVQKLASGHISGFQELRSVMVLAQLSIKHVEEVGILACKLLVSEDKIECFKHYGVEVRTSFGSLGLRRTCSLIEYHLVGLAARNSEAGVACIPHVRD
jgi:hypothetical protein